MCVDGRKVHPVQVRVPAEAKYRRRKYSSESGHGTRRAADPSYKQTPSSRPQSGAKPVAVVNSM